MSFAQTLQTNVGMSGYGESASDLTGLGDGCPDRYLEDGEGSNVEEDANGKAFLSPFRKSLFQDAHSSRL